MINVIIIIGKRATDNVLQLLISVHCNYAFVELDLKINIQKY